MRITNNLLQREAIAGFQHNLREMHRAYKQASSGLRFERPSEDPVATGATMRTDGRLRALEQYRRNIGLARSRLSAEEDVLDQVTDLLTRAKTLAVANAGDTANAQTREAARLEVEQLMATAVQLGNTTFQGSYLFGGQHADTPPFAADGTFDVDRPPLGERPVETSSGQLIATTHDGQTIFVDSQVFAALQELSAALAANDGAAIRSSITTLDAAFSATQNLLGEVGARVNALEVAETNVEAWSLHLQTFRSDLTEIELDEAIARLVNRQTAYEAALLANSRILQTSLTDYLR